MIRETQDYWRECDDERERKRVARTLRVECFKRAIGIVFIKVAIGIAVAKVAALMSTLAIIIF